MIHYDIESLPEYIFPGHDWHFVERDFHPEYLAQTETFFSVSNGYLGLRGSFEEGYPVHLSSTVINGFHELWDIVYGESAYGFAKTGQTIVNVTDAKIIRLFVDDEPFTAATSRMVHFERALDFRRGTLDRSIIWETPAGKRVAIRSRRLASLEHRHLAAISYEVTVENASAPVVLCSEAQYEPLVLDTGGDQRLGHGPQGRVLQPRVSRLDERRFLLGHATERSRMTLACGVDHVFSTECNHAESTRLDEDHGGVTFLVDAKPGVPIRLVKYMAYHSSRTRPAEDLCERAERTLDRAVRNGFEDLVESQQRQVAAFWDRADVVISANPEPIRGSQPDSEDVQQALRFNLFHVLQATARAEGAGIPAKGLTGIGYEGHYFWDTEIYLVPFLVFTNPRVARNLLKFRFGMLDQARRRAAELSQRGALFAWRTINGEEASAYYAAGTAQYHINADIAFALFRYVNATGDEDFLFEEGAEVLIETARLWRDLGFFSERRGGRFVIAGVTGPDEYNTVVNNNLFTNLMAGVNLRFAALTMRRVCEERPQLYEKLVDRTGFEPSEIDDWAEAAEKMFLPWDEDSGIPLQDDEFLEKKPWDFEGTPDENYPLLLHYHPLVIYRHQVIKQADVVLALFLLGDRFSLEEKKRTFDFYDPLTTGDSSLSACIQSIVASEVGYPDKAVEYARYALLMDLADLGKNVKDGVHMASMGGTWMVTVFGFAGFRDHRGRFSFQPRPTAGLERMHFTLTIRGQLLDVEITPETASYTLREGEGLTIWHEDEELELAPDVRVARPIKSGPQASRVPGRAVRPRDEPKA
ncbi:MAG: glycosyl hydrolase family 65 protein [Myxococcota bacterium]|nr:glycosyl hydrolase family 65 protein [Myxococcota bacterium]